MSYFCVEMSDFLNYLEGHDLWPKSIFVFVVDGIMNSKIWVWIKQTQFSTVNRVKQAKQKPYPVFITTVMRRLCRNCLSFSGCAGTTRRRWPVRHDLLRGWTASRRLWTWWSDSSSSVYSWSRQNRRLVKSVSNTNRHGTEIQLWKNRPGQPDVKKRLWHKENIQNDQS